MVCTLFNCYVSHFCLQHLLVLLQKGYDPNQKDFTHDQSAPIHSIVRSQLKDRPKCLQTLLVHGEVDVDLCDAHGMTALHFASMVCISYYSL